MAAKPGSNEGASAKASAASPNPVISGVLPSTGQQGQQNLTVRITGQGTHFSQGTTDASFGAGVIVGGGPLSGFGSITVLSPTSAVAQITISICAATESRVVTVRTGSEVVQLPTGFLVTSATLWTQLSPTGIRPAGRDQHTVVYDIGSDRLLTFGGVAKDGTLLNDVWVLAHANGTVGSPVWAQLSPTGTPPSPRKAHSAVYDAANNRMIVFGGETSASSGAAVSLSNDVWVLTNANGLGGIPAWTQLTPQSPVPPSRRGSAVHYDPASNRLIVFGGLTGSLTALNDVWVLSNANGLGGDVSWTPYAPAGPLPGARQSAYSTYDSQANRLTIFGGTTGQDCAPGAQIYNDAWTLNNANGSSDAPIWVQLAPVEVNGFPGGRQQGVRTSAAALRADGLRFAVVGGETGPDCSFTNEIWLLDYSIGSPSWVRSSPLNDIPLEARAGALGYDSVTDRLIVFGGAGNNETFVLTNLTNVSEPEPNPGLVSVLPNVGYGGQTLDITLLGRCTDFSQGLTRADFGSDLTVNRVTVSSVTRATANVSIPDGAYVGPRDVTASTGLEVARLRAGFTVGSTIPSLVSVNPDTGQQGQQNLSITITGQNTHFAQGLTVVSLGSDISVGTVAVNSPTSLTASITLSPTAAPGGRTVATGTGTETAELANGFTVIAGISNQPPVVNAGSDQMVTLPSVPFPGRYTITNLGTLGGGQFSEALGINNSGQVVGRSGTASGQFHGFSWKNGQINDLGTLAANKGLWSSLPQMGTGRFALALAPGSDGRIYAIGGTTMVVNYPPQSVVEAYDPATRSWTTVAPMPTPRYNLAAASVGNLIYAIGGYNGGPRNTVEAYNPSTNSWKSLAPMPTARHALAVVAARNGKIYAIGGDVAAGGQTTNVVEAYDPATDTWTTVAPMPTSRQLTASLGPDGLIYAIGGLTQPGLHMVTRLEVYDPAKDIWTVRAPMPTARWSLTSALGPDGRIYAIGGNNLSCTFNTVEAYDVVSNTWATVAAIPNLITGLAAVSDASGTIFAVGGIGSFGGSLLFLRTAMSFTIPASGGPNTSAVQINDSALIVGGLEAADGTWHVSSMSNGVQDLGFLTTFPTPIGINTESQIAGTRATALGLRAFSFDGCVVRDPDTLGGPTSSGAGLNDSGDLVGASTGSSGNGSHPFMWTHGATQALPELTAGQGSALAINSLQQAVGYSSSGTVSKRPTVWNGGLPTDLGTLGGAEGTASAINNFGIITGQAATSSGQFHAAMWQQGQIVDLNDVIVGPSGFDYLSSANAINDSGQIAGAGYLNGTLNAFLLNPTQPPAPAVTVNLSGTVSDDGFPSGATLAINWSSVSGPGSVSFSNPALNVPDVAGKVNAAATTATFTVPGTYVLRLSASDSLSMSYADLHISVAPAPAISSVTPSTVQPGQQIVVTVTGVNTHFVQGTSQVSFGAGVTVNGINVLSDTALTAQISVSSSATLGSHGALVKTGSQLAFLTHAMDVTGVPSLLSVSPNMGAQGQSVTVTAVGQNTHFAQGLTTADFGAGLNVASLSVVDATHVSLTVNISHDATVGSRSVTMTSAGESVALPGGFTVSAAPIISQVDPNGGTQGQQNLSVRITGQNTNFIQGTTHVSFGPGITVTSLSINSATSSVAVISIDPAAATGTRTVIATTGSEVATLANAFTIAAQTSTPAISAVSPSSGQQGQSGPVAIAGQNTHFAQGTTQVDFGSGIAVSNVQVTCPTCLTAQLAVSAAAPTGPHAVTVTTGAEVASLAGGFSVTPGIPILTSLNPASGQQGQTFPFTVTGSFTHFAQGTTQVSLGAGVTISGISVTSSTALTAQASIDPAAITGTRTLTVTTGSEVVSAPNVFTVQAVAPVLFSLNPGAGQPGQSLPVLITGVNTHFVQGTSVVSFGTGITVGSVTVANATSLTAQITIASDAASGARTVIVTTGSENASFANGFTVQPPSVFISSLDPGGAAQGQSVSVSIVGQSTHFVAGTTQVSFGPGISVGGAASGGFGPVTVSSATAATAQIAIDLSAPLGLRTVNAQTGTEQASFVNGFTVVAAPILTSINPNTGQPGQNVTVSVVGQNTHFAPGVSVLSFDQYITVTSTSVTDATHLSAHISIAPNALPGPRTVIVTTNSATTGSEIAPLNGGFTIAGPATLSSISPPNGQQGQQNLSVALIGQGTHFAQNTTGVSFGAGITVASLTVNSPTSAVATLNIDLAAAPGLRTITVTTGSEIVSLNNGFSVAAGAPVLTSVSPNTGTQGQTNLLVTIASLYTHFNSSTTQVSFGAGITVLAVTVNSPVSLTASINIDAAASAGGRNVMVTTGPEIVTLTAGFTVQPAVSGPVSLNPASAFQGQSITVAITGTGTHFVQGTTQARFGPGISVGSAIAGAFGSVTVTSPTTATAQIMIVGNALPGSRTVTVQAGSEQDIGTNSFLIQGLPYLSAITPNAANQGANNTIAISGAYTHFVQGTSQVSFGAGVTVTSVTVNSATSLNATISIGAAAIPGVRTASVQTGAETASNGFTILGPVTGPAPIPSITSPASGATVSAPTPVTGTITSPNLAYWTLAYQAPGTPSFVPFASGTSTAVSGILDPSLLLNGSAVIQLTGVDTSGQTAAVSESVVLAKNLKIGIFTVSFNDLSVPVGNLPIQVVRTYDSRRGGINGDFGFGWTLDIRTATVSTNIPLGQGWTGTKSGGVIPTYCVQETSQHLITVSFADGTTYQFRPALSGACQQIVPPSQVSFGFTPDTSTGTTPPNAGLALGISGPYEVSGSFPGPVTLFDLDNVSILDPDQFLSTLPDGRTLQLSRQNGLQKETDLNGNTLTVTPAGITHSSGKSVTFARDGQGRITTVTDPSGHTLNYTYDAAGNLAAFADPANNVSTYTYNPTHGLLTILDPRGVQPIRNDYDASGRLVSHTDAYGNVINYDHDTATSQEIVTDRLGNTTVNQYDAAGNIVKVTDALGGVTTRTYDVRGNPLTETNALNQTRAYTYDANNNRLTETDPLSHTTTYTYNARNQVLTITDPLSHITTNTYDANGNLLSTKDPAGNTTSYVYNSSGLQTSATDALNGVTSNQYDASGNLAQQTDALGNVTTYTYDASGNRLSQAKTRTTSSGSETLVTSYQYDTQNRLVRTTYPDGSTTQIQYNAIGKQSGTVDQLGRQTSYQYDLMGRLIETDYPDHTSEISSYDAEGERVSSTDRAGRTTTYVYDPLKRLTKTIAPDNSISKTAYDAIAEVVAATDALGNVTQYGYDAAGRRSTVTNALGEVIAFAYDAAGNQVSMTDASGNTTQYQYDTDNRRTKTIYPDATFDSVAYDALGRTLGKTDQAGLTTQFQYDKLGRLVQVKDALSQFTKYTYDEFGNRLTQTDANNHTTAFAYDKLGRRTRRTLPLGMVESTTYDAAGNLSAKTDFNGKTTAYAYDLSNRLTSKTPDPSFSAAPITFTYTSTGQRQSMVDASGTTIYSYDLRDRLTQKATPQGTLSYTYDLGGNLTSLQSSNTGGSSVNYTYDALNRLASVKDNRLTAGVTTYTYDHRGNLQSYLYPNGVQTAYTYNTLNRLTNVELAKGAAALASYAYTLGPAGNRTQVIELSGRQVNYSYDSLYRLTLETITAGSVNGSIGYLYDPVGNRLQRTSTVVPVLAGNSSYDANDRLTSDTYDANGNTTASSGNAYGYDFENHLTTRTGSTGVGIVYDGDGNRVAQTVSGTTTRYLVEDRSLTGYAQLLEELAGGAVQRVYTYGLNRISQSQASGTNFYGYDGHGSVRILTDSTGAATDRYDYDAFGNIIGQVGTTPNVYLYSAEQNDPNLGFYYLRARYLNPNTGRFVTSDPFPATGSDPRSLHRYLYADADPINRHDPTGLLTVTELSVTLTINNILSLYQDKLLFPILFQSIQCAECVIAPATEMYNFAVNALADGGGPWAQNLLWHAQAQLVQGYGAIRGIIAQNYANFFSSLVTDSAKVSADFSLPSVKIVYDEVFSAFPALATAAAAGQVVNRGTNIIKKISAFADGVAEAYGYWSANPHSNCGKAMLFGALGAELSQHLLDFGSTSVAEKYSYSIDGMTDAEYRTYVQSIVQQLKR